MEGGEGNPRERSKTLCSNSGEKVHLGVLRERLPRTEWRRHKFLLDMSYIPELSLCANLQEQALPAQTFPGGSSGGVWTQGQFLGAVCGVGTDPLQLWLGLIPGSPSSALKCARP